jgi:hypothetical protein
MNDWQSTYLGRGALPRDLSGFEIEAFFTYSESERRVNDLEYDEDAVGARPVERLTFHRGAAPPDRAHRPDAHGGHQLAGRVHLPDRAIPGPAVTVTSGSKITRHWRLNGSSKTPKRAAFAAHRTAIVFSRLPVRPAFLPMFLWTKYRHSWHGNQGYPTPDRNWVRELRTSAAPG